MTGLQTEFDFVLPKGFVDDDGRLHRQGRMRLATARDELEPLRDPSIEGPEDPLLTVLVLARVVAAVGSVTPVTVEHIEGLFAVDLAFLQDFYGVVNFGAPEDVAALLASQQDALDSLRAATEASEAARAGPAPGPSRPDEVADESPRNRLEEVSRVAR